MTNQTPAVPQRRPQQSVKALLEGDQFRMAVSKALPKHLAADRFIRVAISTLMRTPKLAQCSQESLFGALQTCSQLGIEPDGRRAHLIPYGKDCQLIIDYKGLVELIRRSGEVSDIHCDVVCENDEFTESLGQVTAHVINRREPRGKPFAAYSRVVMKDGTVSCEVMGIDEIEAIRKRSRAGNNGPWKTDWNEMAKKTVFRRHSKWLPFSADIRLAVEADDDQFDHNSRAASATPTEFSFEPDPEQTEQEAIAGGAEPDLPFDDEQKPEKPQDAKVAAVTKILGAVGSDLLPTALKVIGEYSGGKAPKSITDAPESVLVAIARDDSSLADFVADVKSR